MSHPLISIGIVGGRFLGGQGNGIPLKRSWVIGNNHIFKLKCLNKSTISLLKNFVQLKVAFMYSESEICFSNLQDELLQITILSLKFEYRGFPLTRKSLTRFTLTRFLAYVRVSGGISVSRGP